MEYNINRPWESLDPWQEEYIKTPATTDCFLLNGRQTGKTTGMAIKSVELCVKHFKEGENVLIASITEKQGYIMLARALAYASEKYPKLIKKGKDKPTMHKISFTNGTNIYCYAAGETGEGLRGLTIKKLMVDEGSRMSRSFFIAVLPMLSVINGSMDIGSTPCGKEGFFYECSKDEHFKKFYVSAEDCPRHPKEFLEREKSRLSRMEYAQEYLAQFLDELRRIFSDKWINEVCSLKRREVIISNSTSYYCGVDVAGYGKDVGTIEILHLINKDNIEQVENELLNQKLTTETFERIKQLNNIYNFKGIGVDDGGLGFGVFSELMSDNSTKRRTTALNNASRLRDNKEKSIKLLKEEMYQELLILGEQKKIKLLDDDELIASLRSIQYNEDGKITGNYSHIVEGLIRATWLIKTKPLNLYIY